MWDFADKNKQSSQRISGSVNKQEDFIMAKIKTENKYYIQLNELIDEIIPEEWTELAVYVEFPKTSPVFKVYFRKGENGRFFEIKDIPEKYSVAKETFDEQYKKLGSFFFDLRRAYEKEFKGRDCKAISLFVVEEEVVSDYANSIEEKYTYEKRLAIWKYKEIGVIDNPDDATAVEKHFGSIDRGVVQGVKRRPYKDTSSMDEFKELVEIVRSNLWRFSRIGRIKKAMEISKEREYQKYRHGGK